MPPQAQVELHANDEEESGSDFSDSESQKGPSSSVRRLSFLKSRRQQVFLAVLLVGVAITAVCLLTRSGGSSGAGGPTSGLDETVATVAQVVEGDPRDGQIRPVVRVDEDDEDRLPLPPIPEEHAAQTAAGSACVPMAKASPTCQAAVKWAKDSGIHEHPDWYSPLNEQSTSEDFFLTLAHQGHGGCSCAEIETTVVGDGNIPEDTMSTTMPCTDQESCLKIVDAFLDNQPRSYYFKGGAGLLQTFGANTQGGGNCGALCHLPVECPSFDAQGWCRFDVYDNSLAAIYYTMRGQSDKAKQILDSFLELLYPAQEIPGNVTFGVAPEKLPSGRMMTLLAAAYSPIKATAGAYWGPGVGDGAVDTGNNAWAAIAFARYAAATGDQCYALAARDILAVLANHQACYDEFKGFMARLNPFPNPTRSAEHNTDMYALARMLKNTDVQEASQLFVDKMFGYTNIPGYEEAFATGTAGLNIYCNSEKEDDTTPIDAQTWNILADAAGDIENKKAAMRWALLPVEEHGALFIDVDGMGNTHGKGKGDTWTGFRFSSFGAGVQGENTAAGIMAMVHFRDMFSKDPSAVDVTTAINTMRADLKKMLGTYGSVLSSIRGGNAMAHKYSGTDENGNAITAEFPGGTDTGFDWKYLRYPHLASTAWTGMMLIHQADDAQTLNPDGNPYGVPAGNIELTSTAAQECMPTHTGPAASCQAYAACKEFYGNCCPTDAGETFDCCR